ncbi:DUF882 domain-containing protein [Xanthobacter dioxanivorans]|uniref:Murein endopeptidase K n=2 Tax=Xanthobacter dioxanivorans TaxID=2528964 RepID=A0A974SKJ7_9HYPH|nr:DUF882 domain-containing protein [Xanthobacter dioxanivorans]QRG09551.1 DUF882 domain-containing protein [Xanthobacter dioxanivorans]
MRRNGAPALRAAAIGTSLLIAGTSSLQTAVANGDTRTITLHHTHSGEDGTFTFKKNGRYDPEALAKLNHFLRDWRNQKSTQMDPQLFDIVWEVYRETNASAPIQIVSSYRSPETNSMLRSRSRGVAKFSQHMLGKAMDFYIPGVNLTDLRVAGLRLQRGGVGFYPTSGSPFVHMDTGNVRHWPRMNHDQLARVFPDGKTVHVPSDGRPLSNYNAAVAELQARGSKPGVAVASAGGKNFLASLFGRKDADDEESGAENATASASAPEPAAPAPAREGAPRTQLAALAPLPPSRPAEIAAGAMLASQASSGVPVPFPQRRPAEAEQERNARVASLASAMAPLPPVITRGTQARGAGADTPALSYAAARVAGDNMGDLLGNARFLAGGLMAQAAEEPAPAGRPRGARGGTELAAGRMFLSTSVSSQSYLRSPEVRSLAELMEPPHDVTPAVYAMTFSMQPTPGDVWPDLRGGGLRGVAITQRM